MNNYHVFDITTGRNAVFLVLLFYFLGNFFSFIFFFKIEPQKHIDVITICIILIIISCIIIYPVIVKVQNLIINQFNEKDAFIEIMKHLLVRKISINTDDKKMLLRTYYEEEKRIELMMRRIIQICVLLTTTFLSVMSVLSLSYPQNAGILLVIPTLSLITVPMVFHEILQYRIRICNIKIIRKRIDPEKKVFFIDEIMNNSILNRNTNIYYQSYIIITGSIISIIYIISLSLGIRTIFDNYYRDIYYLGALIIFIGLIFPLIYSLIIIQRYLIIEKINKIIDEGNI